MLSNEARAALETLGPENVRSKLLHAGPGRGASVDGFDALIGMLTRGDIEDWLAEKHIEEANERKRTLRWAVIAGWAGIAGAIIGIISIIITVLLAMLSEA
jgi:hypothetical protein